MDQGYVLRRAESLKNTAFDSSEHHSVSRPLYSRVSRSHSVSELVAKYQDVVDREREKTSTMEQKVLNRYVQEIKRDFMKITSISQDQIKKDFTRGIHVPPLSPSVTSTTRENSRNFQTTLNINEDLSSLQFQVSQFPKAQTTSSTIFKKREIEYSRIKPGTLQSKEIEDKHGRNLSMSSEKDAQKQRNAFSHHDSIIRKKMSPHVKRRSESWKRDSAEQGTLCDFIKEKNDEKTSSYSDRLDSAGHTAHQRQLKTSVSVKERSALYLSKTAAATYRASHAKPFSTEEIVLSFSCPKLNKPVTTELCSACFKPVYPVQRVAIDEFVLHLSCFCCKHCRKRLSLDNYAVHLGELFCKVHHIQLFKARRNKDQSLICKPPKEQQTSEPSGLAIESSSQPKGVEKTVKEHVQRWQGKAVGLDPGCGKERQGEMHLSSNCSNKLQPRNKLGMNWPIEDTQENASRAAKVKWSPQNISLVVGSNKAVFNRVEMIANQTRCVTADHAHEKKKSSILPNTSFSKRERILPTLNKTECGKGILKGIKQKLFFTARTTPRTGKLYQERRMAENLTVLQHNKPTIENAHFPASPFSQVSGNYGASKTPGALPTNSRAFKAIQGTDQVLVTASKPSVRVSVAGQCTNDGNKTSEALSSKDIKSDKIMNVGRQRKDPLQKPMQNVSDPLRASEPMMLKNGELYTSKGVLQVEKEFREYSDQDPAPYCDTDNTDFIEKNVTQPHAAQTATMKANQEKDTTNKVIPFNRDINPEAPGNLNAKEELSKGGKEGPGLDTAHWRSTKMLSINEALRKTNANMAENEILLLNSENGVGKNEGFKEMLQGKYSYAAKPQKNISDLISHDSELDKANSKLSEYEQMYPTDPHSVFQFQKTDVLNSEDPGIHKVSPECRVLAEHKVNLYTTKVLAEPEILGSVNTHMETSTLELQPGKFNCSETAHLKMKDSDDILDSGKFHLSNFCESAIDTLTANEPMGKSEDPKEPRNLLLASSHAREGSSDTRSTILQSKEHKKTSTMKEQLSKMSSFGRNPLPELCFSDNEDRSTARKENKKSFLPKLKAQSEWGKLFGYSSDSIIHERKQKDDVAKSTPNSQGTNRGKGPEELQNAVQDHLKQLICRGKKEDESVAPNLVLNKNEEQATQTESLLQLQNSSALDSSVFPWVLSPNTSNSSDKIFGTANLQIQRQPDGKCQTLQQNDQLGSELIHSKELQEECLMPLEESSLSQPDTNLVDSMLIATANTKEENHETLLPEIVHADHQVSKSISKNCAELCQLRDKHQEFMFYLGDSDLLQATAKNNHGISNPEISYQTNSDISKSQSKNRPCSDLKLQEISFNELLNESSTPFLKTEVNINITKIDSNSKFIQQFDILPKLQIDDDDPFGLALDVVNSGEGPFYQPEANSQPPGDPMLVQCIPDNTTGVTSDTLSSAAEMPDSALF